MASASHKPTVPEALTVLTEGSVAMLRAFFSKNALASPSGGNTTQSEVKSCVIVVEETAKTDGLPPPHIISLANFISSRQASKSPKSLLNMYNVCTMSYLFQTLQSQAGQCEVSFPERQSPVLPFCDSWAR